MYHVQEHQSKREREDVTTRRLRVTTGGYGKTTDDDVDFVTRSLPVVLCSLAVVFPYSVTAVARKKRMSSVFATPSMVAVWGVARVTGRVVPSVRGAQVSRGAVRSVAV